MVPADASAPDKAHTTRSDSRLWFRLTHDFPNHPKILQAGEDAAYLYVCGLAYCAQYLTDGAIPKAAVRTLVSRRAPQRAQALVDAGLWKDVNDTYVVPDYPAHQRSKAQIEAEREANRRRQASWRAKQAA